MDSETKKQLSRVKALIERKRYKQALILLAEIDHPVADKWTKKLKRRLSSSMTTADLIKQNRKAKKQPTNLPIQEDSDTEQPLPPLVEQNQKNNVGAGCLLMIALLSIFGLWIAFRPNAGDFFDDGTPEGAARAAVADVFGSERAEEIQRLEVNDEIVILQFPLSQGIGNTAGREGLIEFPRLICALQERGLSEREYQISGTITVKDVQGNTCSWKGIDTTVSASTASQLYCDSDRTIIANLGEIAERYEISRVLSRLGNTLEDSLCPSADVEDMPSVTATPIPRSNTQQNQSRSNRSSRWNCSGDRYNCSSFNSCSDMRDYFNSCPGDPSRLDRDNDGIPCESC